MKAFHLALILVLLSIVIAIITSTIIKDNTTYGMITIPMDIGVDEFIGVTADTDALHFGVVMPPGSSRREFLVQNKFKRPMDFRISVLGEMSNWTSIDPANFRLDPGQSKDVLFEVKIERGTGYGNYTGTAYIYYNDI